MVEEMGQTTFLVVEGKLVFGVEAHSSWVAWVSLVRWWWLLLGWLKWWWLLQDYFFRFFQLLLQMSREGFICFFVGLGERFLLNSVSVKK